MINFKTLPEPDRPANLGKNAQWLAGEGAGSWFVIEPFPTFFRVKRFSPDGKIECEGDFINASATPFDAEVNFEITYLSHCERVTVLQNQRVIVLRRIHQNKLFSTQ